MKKQGLIVAMVALGMVLPAQSQVLYTGIFATGMIPQRGVLEEVVSYGAGAEYMAGLILARGLAVHANIGYSRLQTKNSEAIHYVPVKFGYLYVMAPFALESRFGLASFIDDGYSTSFLTELEAGVDIGNFYLGVGGGSFYHAGTGGRLNNEMGSSSGYLQARLRLRLSARVLH